MKTTRTKYLKQVSGVFLFLALLIWFSSPALARDTDIYKVNAKQNCYVLMDSSESMNFGVYQNTIDYGAMFDYLFTLNDSPVGDYPDYIYDTVNNGSYYYQNHLPVRKIYLAPGDIGVTIATVDGQSVAFSGDAADPDYRWYSDQLIDTCTLIDINGNLSDATDVSCIGKRRLTVDASGYILFDGVRLPLGLDIKEHDFVTLYNGSVVDNGFNGLLNAPGYYFSGYEGVTAGALNPVESGDVKVYFFITGNWMNMQAMYNLHYTTNNPTPTGAAQGDAAWPYESFPITPDSWTQLAQTLKYPASGNYAKSLTEATTAQSIISAGAQKIQVHFSAFNVQGNNNASTFTKDYVKIYDKAGAVVGQYDNDNKPTSGDGWSPVITGDTATLKLSSNNDTITGTGYTIDKIRVVYVAAAGGSYLMQSRMNIAKDALTYVVDAFRGKMNWGFASFKDDGAQVGPFLNATDNDDLHRSAIITAIKNVNPPADTAGVVTRDNTPLMGALQDVWAKGYEGRKTVMDKLLCRKNYVISMTDGFPSKDTNNAKITLPTVTFGDWDSDGWTSDPYQSPTSPNFYDDVAHWMYTHSWLDRTAVTDPAHSYVNVITHHVAFGAKQPMLQDAAKGKLSDGTNRGSGGEYIVAYNKEQLVAAFYSLALMMSQSVSFTAPVVSVDADNKIQSGEDLYMGLFLPMDSTYWAGNVKKFKIGDDPATTTEKELFAILDKNNQAATNSNGEFLDNTATFWGDDTDLNDSDSYGAADIKEDGAGEVLLEDVQGFFTAATYWKRPIYTWKNGAMVKFDRNNITALDLGVADDATRDKLINFTHGYTYDAVAVTGVPLAVRNWILGPIIHSRPVVVDYFDTSIKTLPLLKRLVVVGSNDGMLHVLNDDTGREEFAFIPADILTKLKDVQATISLYDTVDGLITLYRRDKNPKYLIFGERRGGAYFWNLDVHDQNPLNWTVAWSYTNAEISQSWSEVKVASIPVAVTEAGKRTYKDVAIITGGFDPEEDFFPEPFTDDNSNGAMDTGEWSKTDPIQDVNNDDIYNKYNPDMNERGRGIYVVDIDDPAAVTNVTLDNNSTKKLLPFSVTYGAAPVTTGAVQTLPDMKFSFPASPSVVTGLDKYIYTEGAAQVTGLKENVLLSLYAIDVYANLFKTRFTFDLINYPSGTTPHWYVKSADWTVNKVFSANPGSSIASGESGVYLSPTDVKRVNVADQGRKAFYPPTISWGGSKGFFEAGNYYFPNVTFDTKDKMASLFFGTGDRENPKYTMIRNRFYAIYDDSSVKAQKLLPLPVTNVPVTSAPYFEDDLLNLTCDELGKDSIIKSCYLGSPLADGTTCSLASADMDMKRYLNSLLTDNAAYGTTPALEYGAAHENDAKGWYIVLDKQGDSTVCSHMNYPFTTINDNTSVDPDNHEGEQILSQVVLYFGNLYFTSYQASISDPCNPQGNGFTYALNYLNGSATFDMDAVVDGTERKDVTDRYNKYTGIFGIPSGFTVITREGQAAAMASIGGAVKGPGRDGGFEIPTPGLGLQLYYWRDSNSRQP